MYKTAIITYMVFKLYTHKSCRRENWPSVQSTLQLSLGNRVPTADRDLTRNELLKSVSIFVGQYRIFRLFTMCLCISDISIPSISKPSASGDRPTVTLELLAHGPQRVSTTTKIIRTNRIISLLSIQSSVCGLVDCI